MFNVGLLASVKVDFGQLLAIELVSNSLTDNFSWVHQVVEDGFVNGGEGTAHWALVLHGDVLLSTLRLGEDTTL